MSGPEHGHEERQPSHPDLRATAEEEPLLEGAGGVSIVEGQSLVYNFTQGTAALAQVGGLVLVAIVWASVFTHPVEIFDGHPLLNSLGILLVVQGVLVLQPTGFHDPVQKKRAAYFHATLIMLADAAFIAASAIVLWHKYDNHLEHFKSAHGYLGVITYILVLLQTLVGFTQLFTPQLYGGEENAKKIYKYHRIFGYFVILPLLLITAITATFTPYVADVLQISTWPMVLASLAIVLGVYRGVKVAKLKGHVQTVLEREE